MKSFDVEGQSTPVKGEDTIERWKIMKSEYTTVSTSTRMN